MSIEVQAIPFALIFSLAANAITQSINNSIVAGLQSGNSALHLEDKEVEKTFFNKNFDTIIMDKNALIKTLKEHGATSIKENGENIECNCQYFHLNFTKENENSPYKMQITASENKGLDEFASDIGSEYTLNAQEISYNKIKERLEAQNLKISEEEIYEDNTIVLTVDLGD